MGAPASLVRSLQRFRRGLKGTTRVERMILFGSRARGRTHRWSDVDLIVVSRDFRGKGAIERAVPLHLAWDLELPVDFLCYAPEEFRRLARRVSLVRQALREGAEIPP
ncbi:MAG TPA: nucleotidyltransferase domain-containing protein [Thermoplasmata archaeon]|nr:nucleotidyltransferase domain-containing protein [Thermoplasmata archaeon]